MEVDDMEGHAYDLLTQLDEQRHDWPGLCDVSICVEGQEVRVHRCVLAASSRYFKILFTGDFKEVGIERCMFDDFSFNTVQSLVDYWYTGKISINSGNIEEILSMADYLCIQRVKEYCVKFLKENLSVGNCLLIRYLSEKFSLDDLTKEVTDFMAPRMTDILETPSEDDLTLPFDFIEFIIKNKDLNYVNEPILCNFIHKWINHDFLSRKKHISVLLSILEPSFLTDSYIKDTLISAESLLNTTVTEDVLSRFKGKVSENTPLRDRVETVICRSRNVSIGEEVKLVSYVPEIDAWHLLSAPGRHLLDGLESLITHQGAVYLLVSQTEDMYGYMNHAEEKKYFYRLDLTTNHWQMLPSPTSLQGVSRLVSHQNGIFIIDRFGNIEEYNQDTKTCMKLLDRPVFDCTNTTWYVLPMALDRYMYILRVFATGYAYSFDQVSYSMMKIDTVRKTTEKLAEIEACDLEMDEKVKLCGYIAQTNHIILKNELGMPVLKFDLTSFEFSKIDQSIKLPVYIRDVWGCVQGVGRLYFVGKSTSEKNVLMFYDFKRQRFKATAAPPVCLSGLMCHMTLPRDACMDWLHAYVRE